MVDAVRGQRAFSSDERRWTAVAGRDKKADGVFFYAVWTTGVYCRPSCPGRPKRENVAFHATCEDAERAGFRACKRCRPKDATCR
jgi:AraC family transcriptional regulator of adaptative response/methylated-DNA-[protein]-cysteine methyltransferase